MIHKQEQQEQFERLSSTEMESQPKPAFYEETFADGIEWYRTEPFGNWMPKPFKSIEGTKTERAEIEKEAAGWMKSKGYDRKTWNGTAKIIADFIADRKYVPTLEKPQP